MVRFGKIMIMPIRGDCKWNDCNGHGNKTVCTGQGDGGAQYSGKAILFSGLNTIVKHDISHNIMTIQLRPNIAAMQGYVPGYQPPDIASWIKLNTNENSYPPSPKVVDAILEELGVDGARLHTYPSASSQQLREVAGELYGFEPSWIIMANGSDEVLNNLIRAFAAEGEEIGYVHPSYSYYATLAEIQGARVRTYGLTDDFRIAGFPERYEGKIFFLTTPNAPLGPAFPIEYIEEIAQRCAGMLVLDETYADFADGTALDLVRKYDNVVVTRSLSKSYALAGMRLGLAIARPEVIAALDKIRDHYNLDRLAQAACVAALRDQPYLRECCLKIRETREWFAAKLRAMGYEVIPSQGNYVFASPADRNGKRVYDGLYARKILVRHFSDPLLAHGLRISIGTRAEMEATLQAMKDIG